MRYFTVKGDQKLFRCPCGDCMTMVNPRLPMILDSIRSHVGEPMHITSGPRCQKYNDSLPGSAKYSEHIDGDGADVACDNSRMRLSLIDAALAHGITRIGVGKTFVHLGISETNDQNVLWVY